MRENPVTRRVIKLVCDYGFWIRKIHGSEFMAGWPDICAIGNGRTCWCETKRPPSKPGGSDGGKLSKIQIAEFSKMHRQGAVIFVGDDARELADRILLFFESGSVVGRWYPPYDQP